MNRVEKYNWDQKTGNLLSKVTEDKAGKIYLREEYKYDKNQNIIEKTVGDDTQSYKINYTYSEDGFNLKLSETDDFGKKITYSYVKGTDLLYSEFVYEGEKIVKRSFHFYDDCAICIKTIVDDGKSADPYDLSLVTFRKITCITPRQKSPCFGLPEIVEEKTIDPSGQEILLSKVKYLYTPFGKILSEEHFDNTNAFRFVINYEYDSKERLIKTTDGLGQKTVFSYDVNNNLTSVDKEGFKKSWVYDKANRPIKESEDKLSTQKKYDKLGRQIASCDESGFETKYKYNAQGQVIAIFYPDGTSERKEYDILGNVIKEIDPKGYETKKSYHFSGQVTSIIHPDATEETFAYRPDGQLLFSIDRNRAKTVYTYDIFGRVLKEEIFSSSNILLKSKYNTYSSFCILSTTDAEGITTFYTYDFAGRKLSSKTATKQSFFFYDALGRLFKTQVGDLSYIDEFDHLDRVIEKKVIDASGQIIQRENYSYDCFGNKTKVTNSKGVLETTYNSRNEPTQIKDALGHVTKISYIYDKGLTKTTTNPKGISKIQIFDACHREKETLVKNSEGEIKQKTTRTFDANDNLIESTHYVFEGVDLVRTVVNSWEYGPQNRIESLIESNKKKTSYEYDTKGRLKTIIKPNDEKLNHEYDDLGRLIHYFSSDFDYRYTYDKVDRLISVMDVPSKTTTFRSYDALGNLLHEELANGLVLKNRFDSLGRRIAIALPDESEISYSYKGDKLYQISRKNLTHTYEKRDLEGNIEKSSLAGSLGTVAIERDALSRWKTYSTPFYTSLFPKEAYDACGNLRLYTFTDSLGTFESDYMYDDLDQMIAENEHIYYYDSLHNRTCKDRLSYTFNTLNQIVDKEYEYDVNGNLIRQGACLFEYDSQDRLIGVKKDKWHIKYTYDPFHRRLSKRVYEDDDLEDTVYYLWDGNNEIGATNKRKSIKELRVLGEGHGAEIGAAVLIEIDGRSYVPIHDHQGSIVTLVDVKSKSIKETYRYTAFGEQITNNRFTPWGFGSKRVDYETGFIFFGRRYYSPFLGRWITPDPRGLVEGPNLYAYVYNNPLTHFDLYGLWANPYAGTRNLGDFVKRTYQSAFRGIELMGMHLVPVPGVRDLVESVGRWGRGGNFFELCEYRRCQNQVYSISGKEVAGRSLFHINGMNTSLEEAKHAAEEMSKSYGGSKVDLLYNGSRGFITDFIGCCLGKMGVKTHVDKMAAHYFSSKLKEDSAHVFEGTAHSQGATHLMNAGKIMKDEARQHIHVTAYGPSTIIPKKFFADATNYVSRLDVVPFTSPRIFLGGDNIRFLTPHSMCPLKEHSFLGKTYWNVVHDSGAVFCGQHY